MSRWTFTDPMTAVSYTLEIGPGGTAAVTLPRKRRVTYSQGGVAPDRTPVIMLGPNERSVLTLSGTLLSQAQLDALNVWHDKSRFIYITDFLGQQYTALLSKFTPKRERAASAPYKHSWTIDAYVFANHLLPSPVLVPGPDVIPF